jgi:IMP dehydrogenase
MATKLNKKFLSFSEIFIVPQYSEIETRDKVDTSSLIGPLRLDLPIISANMTSITDVGMAVSMAESGGFGILPRFNTNKEAGAVFIEAKNRTTHPIGVSIGVHEVDKIRFKELFRAGARVFCIDVAHGHHVKVKNMLSWIRKNYGFYRDGEWDKANLDISPIIIAGNVASHWGVKDLHTWGADIIKVGVGPGSCCQTRRNTGVGVPQFGLLEDIDYQYKLADLQVPPLISDGGIKYPSDVVKALIFSNAVMVGGIIAGTTETPGHVYENEHGGLYKKFGGSASGESKVSNGGTNRFVEGHMTDVPFRGKVKYILLKIQEGLKSGISYSGANNIPEFKECVIYGEMSLGGTIESKLN